MLFLIWCLSEWEWWEILNNFHNLIWAQSYPWGGPSLAKINHFLFLWGCRAPKGLLLSPWYVSSYMLCLGLHIPSWAMLREALGCRAASWREPKGSWQWTGRKQGRERRRTVRKPKIRLSSTKTWCIPWPIMRALGLFWHLGRRGVKNTTRVWWTRKNPPGGFLRKTLDKIHWERKIILEKSGRLMYRSMKCNGTA